MEAKASPKREFRQLRTRNQKALRSSLSEVIAKANNGGSAVVSHVDDGFEGEDRCEEARFEADAGKINAGCRGNKVSVNYPPSPSVEERLNLLRRKHLMKAANAAMKSRRCWRPELQSIPEE
ncbi:Mechanosensitive ion channel domain-containing protein isoform 1 [Hibiscus syriacus]|uniref:Mechanosensitive ion channel domain-containing protein isoform 1 n=1 Tax=Hibiscus syriacus TaxID=106335 RepID=A0A6A3CA66_HIBSY|nr:Mechanosensitive ion channel domain-containing protein isoform 1 [Hibiscus syriacus]